MTADSGRLRGDLGQAIRSLWERRRGNVLARVRVLDDAVEALRADALTPELRREAEGEAHKLAGSIGSFGFMEASARARELELALAPGRALSNADAERLAAAVACLRAELEGEPADGGPA